MAASIINTNLMSLNAQKNLNKNALSLDTAVERLSSGLRVNSARDDAAGLAVGMSLTSTVRSLSVEIRNAADLVTIDSDSLTTQVDVEVWRRLRVALSSGFSRQERATRDPLWQLTFGTSLGFRY